MSEAVVHVTGAGALIKALTEAGVRKAFGVPGVHALGIVDALDGGEIEFVGNRTELAAAFSADGYARRTGEPTLLLLSTGPGTLMALGGVLESASSHVPVVVVSTQVRLEEIGRRRGSLHEVPDQIGSIRPLVKWARRALSGVQIPHLAREAVEVCMRPPSGPVYLELPVDLVEGATEECTSWPMSPPADPEFDLGAAAKLLDAAAAPVIWAGGGVVRGGGFEQLLALAERLDAPVATTYMGKGSIDERHPLSAGSACEERALLSLISTADVVLAVGTEFGAETTAQWGLEFQGTVIQVDAAAERIGTTYRSLPLIGDAGDVMDVLRECVRERRPDQGRVRAETVREAVRSDLERGDRDALALLEMIRQAVPWEVPSAWDMTISGYWAASAFPVAAGRTWLYPLGSGTLGYALPAALGAAAAGRRVLAVSGDGGAMYGLSELAVLRQHGLPVTWLIVDDGGYGVLQHYQEAAYGRHTAVELVRPDFVQMADSAGVPATRAEMATLGEILAAKVGGVGPQVVVLEASLAPPPALS